MIVFLKQGEKSNTHENDSTNERWHVGEESDDGCLSQSQLITRDISNLLAISINTLLQ